MKRLLICGGKIVDGTGAKAKCGNVLVVDDRIEDILPVGVEIEGFEGERIDATGRLVTPGFIDAHSHSDAYLVIEPQAPSKLTQGITTEINGQCGGSIAPRYGEARLSSDWKALLGERLTWRTLAEYREVLTTVAPAINTVQFIGHNTLRSSVMGYVNRRSTPDDLKRMLELLAQALDEGGWGLTTGLIYPPGKYSTPDEVTALAHFTAKRGGYYATHMRSEGERLLESIDEVLKLVRATGIRAEISHLKTSGRENWHKLDQALEKIDNAIQQGELLGSDRYPYCAAGTDLDIVIADDGTIADRDWSEVMIGGTWHPDNKRYSGRRVSEILAEQPGVSAAELIHEIVRKDGGKTGGFFFTMCEENLDRIYAQEWVVPGSDASLRAPWGPLGADFPHPRAYATMPEFYRRNRRLGFSCEATVARMTSVIARRFGIARRGMITRGAYADLLVWREEDFAACSTFADPHRFSSGIEAVVVNGVLEIREGKFTNDRGGRFLERKQ